MTGHAGAFAGVVPGFNPLILLGFAKYVVIDGGQSVRRVLASQQLNCQIIPMHKDKRPYTPHSQGRFRAAGPLPLLLQGVLMALDTWFIYLLASIGLSLTPGPNSLLALTHGARYGARRTLFTILGGMCGFSALIALAMFGLSALLQTSGSVLQVLKWVGGAYLLWLGIQLWRAPPLHLDLAQGQTRLGNAGLFRQGLLSALSNPKVLLFYGAFLPQFIDPQRGLALQFIVMAATFACVECLVEYLLARLAGRIRPWLAKGGKGFNRCCGALFAMIAVALPLGR